ncbi:MAG: hypothetical protein H8E55_05245 [Pelagibacterales bacterium]|nr:hypothetical protein [Pelagibacterales bacterium]
MKDIKNKKFTEIERLEIEKRRKYMKAYYLRTKLGKGVKKKKTEDSITIRRGKFLVYFE